LSITRIASATTRTEKVVGMHFSNPVQRLTRLEIVKGLETSEETVRITMGVGRKMGKDPRLTKRDYPGFSGTRLLSLFINEAFYLVEQGICEPEDVDVGVAKQSFGHSMGPFETADLVGLDTLLNILNYLYKELGEKYRPCPLIEKLVEANYLGRKTGRGVYDYSTGTRKVWMTFN
jgi:3-hydroxybutyryl-CoA dehydrogenase